MNVAQFASRYATALAAYVDERSERGLRTGYELGRDAVDSVTLLDVASVHASAVADLSDTDPAAAAEIVRQSGEFLVEVLSAFEMVRRSAPEAQEAADVERWRGAMVRRLSELLSDEALAAADAGTVQELLRLVAEYVLEVTDAQRSCVVVSFGGINEEITVDARQPNGVSMQNGEPWRPSGSNLHVPLRALDGSTIGSLLVTRNNGTALRRRDEELVRHVAEMTAAMVERAGPYF